MSILPIFIIIAFVAVIAYVISHNASSNKNRPNKGDLFACSSCGEQTKHDTRTINGYNKGVRQSFLCWECFKNKKNAQAASVKSEVSTKGCLGLSLIMVAVGLSGLYGIVNWAVT